MPIHFDETMVGKLETPDGPKRFSFSVSVDGDSFWGAWGRDLLRLSGRASLEGHVVDARLAPESYLRISLPFRRILSYSIAFRDVDGRVLRFFGSKRIRYLIFALTIRKLRGTVFVDGKELGQATLYFRFRTLPAFLSSLSLKAG